MNKSQIRSSEFVVLNVIVNNIFLKKLKPDKFIMGKPSQNYGVPPKYGAHNFTGSPT